MQPVHSIFFHIQSICYGISKGKFFPIRILQGCVQTRYILRIDTDFLYFIF